MAQHTLDSRFDAFYSPVPASTEPCSICYLDCDASKPDTEPVALSCTHSFCRSCITAWFAAQSERLSARGSSRSSSSGSSSSMPAAAPDLSCPMCRVGIGRVAAPTISVSADRLRLAFGALVVTERRLDLDAWTDGHSDEFHLLVDNFVRFTRPICHAATAAAAGDPRGARLTGDELICSYLDLAWQLAEVSGVTARWRGAIDEFEGMLEDMVEFILVDWSRWEDSGRTTGWLV